MNWADLLSKKSHQMSRNSQIETNSEPDLATSLLVECREGTLRIGRYKFPALNRSWSQFEGSSSDVEFSRLCVCLFIAMATLYSYNHTNKPTNKQRTVECVLVGWSLL